jgi:hypothetical protein
VQNGKRVFGVAIEGKGGTGCVGGTGRSDEGGEGGLAFGGRAQRIGAAGCSPSPFLSASLMGIELVTRIFLESKIGVGEEHGEDHLVVMETSPRP